MLTKSVTFEKFTFINLWTNQSQHFKRSTVIGLFFLYSRLPSQHPSCQIYRSMTHPLSIYNRSHHSFYHALLIHSLDIPKLSQVSGPCNLHISFPFFDNFIFTFSFLTLSIRITLYILLKHCISSTFTQLLSSSLIRLCYIQYCWYNYSFTHVSLCRRL